MVLTDKILDELLNYVDNSFEKLTIDTMSNPEFHMDHNDLNQFLDSQYELRLDNLLKKQNSNVHHLESKTKNKIIQRKQKLLDSLLKEFNI